MSDAQFPDSSSKGSSVSPKDNNMSFLNSYCELISRIDHVATVLAMVMYSTARCTP